MAVDWTVKFTDLAIIGATLTGPILAILAQGFIDWRRELRRRREGVFFTLMRSRMAPASQEHVNALNAIPLEFWSSTRQAKSVRAAWRLYLNHLNLAGQIAASDAWAFRRVELLNGLLEMIGRMLGFDVDRAELESGVYFPTALGQIEAENAAIRAGLAKMLSEGTFPMMLKPGPDADAQLAAAARRIILGLDAWLARANDPTGGQTGGTENDGAGT